MAKTPDQAKSEIAEAKTILKEATLSGANITETVGSEVWFASTIAYNDGLNHIFLNHYKDPDTEQPAWLFHWSHDRDVMERRQLEWEDAKALFLDAIRMIQHEMGS